MSRTTRYLPWLILLIIAGIGVCSWASGLNRGNGSPERSSRTGPSLAPTTRAPAQKHYVTPRQLVASNARVSQVVRELDALTHDGRRLNWESLSRGRPVVLVFIKAGCPCNVEFAPYFERVEQLYEGRVQFAGVIDGDPHAGRSYADAVHVSHPILADPEQRIIKNLGAENGGYAALLTPDGVIDGFWPGCSADGMKELSRRIARLARVSERTLDLSGMPGPLTTGCPFAH